MRLRFSKIHEKYLKRNLQVSKLLKTRKIEFSLLLINGG